MYAPPTIANHISRDGDNESKALLSEENNGEKGGVSIENQLQWSDVNPMYAAERERLNRVNRTTAFTREQTRNADRKKSDDEMRKKYPRWMIPVI